MKVVLATLIAIIAMFLTLYGLLMINFPHGGHFGLTQQLLDKTSLKDFFVAGIVLVSLGIFNLGALFSLYYSGTHQFNWSIATGFLLISCVLSTILILHLYHWLQVILLGAGVMIILLSIQLKGKWIA